MSISGLGRFVFVAQWVAAVVMPLIFFIGRAFLGAEGGWLVVLGVVYAPIVIVLMLIPALITLFDREVRKAKATRRVYSVTSIVFWILILLGSLVVPDAGDSGSTSPALTVWTGGAVGIEAATVIFGILGSLILVAYVALIVVAIIGAIRARRA